MLHWFSKMVLGRSEIVDFGGLAGSDPGRSGFGVQHPPQLRLRTFFIGHHPPPGGLGEGPGGHFLLEIQGFGQNLARSRLGKYCAY